MNITEALLFTENTLKSAEIIPYKFEAAQLVAFVADRDSKALRIYGADPLAETQEKALTELVQRRVGGEPLQYILGEWEFYSLPFKVGPGVLIPRADTELLVDCGLEYIKDKASPQIADLCSGSGCIAIAMAKNRPDGQVWAYELSDDALEYLRYNNEQNNAGVTVIKADITAVECDRKFDIILSNPPYIETETIPELDVEVLNEPLMALDGGNDGLDFYRIIAKNWTKHLKPGGALMVEIGINQHNAVSHIFQSAGLENIRQVQDINGIERVIIGTLPL